VLESQGVGGAGQLASQVSQNVAAGYIASYGRDQELQADQLGALAVLQEVRGGEEMIDSKMVGYGPGRGQLTPGLGGDSAQAGSSATWSVNAGEEGGGRGLHGNAAPLLVEWQSFFGSKWQCGQAKRM